MSTTSSTQTTSRSRTTGRITNRPAMLPPDLPDVDLDVVITVGDGDQGPVNFSAFANNYFDLEWWNTMDQSKVSPVAFTAHKTVDGRSFGPTPLTLTGSAILWNPSRQEWSPWLAIPATYHLTGQARFDPRSMVTADWPWVYSIGIIASASASYGVGWNRQFARTVVHADGTIGYIN